MSNRMIERRNRERCDDLPGMRIDPEGLLRGGIAVAPAVRLMPPDATAPAAALHRYLETGSGGPLGVGRT